MTNSLPQIIAAALLGCLLARVEPWAADSSVSFEPLFNGQNLEGWDTYLAPPPGSRVPLGLNHDPHGIFKVVQEDGAPAIRISGEIYGALSSHREFTNFHLRVEYKWGEKRWPPRATVGRDSGILYWCVGPHGAGSGAWMRSVECNIMEKGTGQWWAVAGTHCDVEGRRVTPEMEPRVPYKKEGAGESIILYEPGAPRLMATPADGVTPPVDYEKTRGEWNTCEVVAWANVGIHLLAGQVNLVLTNPRHFQDGREIPLRSGKLQLQSEAAEIYYRKIEIRPITSIPAALLRHVPSFQDGEEGFRPLLGKDANEGWAQCGPGRFTISEGVATGHGGMGLWWHTNQMFTNFVLRGEWVQDQELADSGVFVRFPHPGQDPWNAVRQGHEIEIGDPKPDKAAEATGSIYPFQGPAHVPVKPYGQWNEYEIACIGHNYSVRINGQLVNTWTDPQGRSLAGYIGLQNYNDGKTVRHRKLRIKPLP